MQETYVSIAENASSYHGGNKAMAWIFRIAKNFTLMHFRREKKTESIHEVEEKVDKKYSFSFVENLEHRLLLESVLHQVISTENTNASTFAKENNISLGKAVFVLNLAKKDSSLSAKELAKMRISDIAKLVAEKNIDIRDIIEYDSDDSLWENIADAIEDINEGDDDYIVVETEKNSIVVQPTETAAAETQEKTGAQSKPDENSAAGAQTLQKISADKAKSIAFGHAGVSAGQVAELSVEYDNDDGVYEIDFKVGGVEYDYEIAASNGAVRKADAERDD